MKLDLDALLANMTAFVEYAAQNDAAVASGMAEMEAAIAQMSSVNEFMASLEDATSFGELIDAHRQIYEVLRGRNQEQLDVIIRKTYFLDLQKPVTLPVVPIQPADTDSARL